MGAHGQVLAQHDIDGQQDDIYFYLHDRLGSVRLIIEYDSQAGSVDVVKYYIYEPFGQVLDSGGTFDNPFMFTGQYFDSEIEEYYLRARQYNPHISRFTSRDPVAGKFKEPLTLHRYLYCLNDPVNGVDPSGEMTFTEMKVEMWIRHVAGLETRLTVQIVPGPELTIQADRSQLDQLLINIISNAVEASLEAGRPTEDHVVITWKVTGSFLDVRLDDDGPGLDTTTDPFVPFFTTKSKGSGIGLVLSRQIAEAHGGYLTLTNHPDREGCRALLRLPIEPLPEQDS